MEPNGKKKLVTYGAIAVADPDLQLRGGGGGGGAGGLKNIFFWPLGPQFALKISGRPGPLPLDPPLVWK